MLVGDTGFEPVTSSVSGRHLCVSMRRVWGLEPVQGRLCLPLCGAVGRQFGRQCRRHSVLTDVGRIVAVPKAVLRTRALSRHWSPPVVGPGPYSSFAYQCVAATAGVSGLELAAGVSVAVSAEIRLSVDRARAMSSRISTRFAPAMAPRIAGTSPISRTPHPRRRSHRRDQPMTTEF